jgi:hypothetical protein
VVPILLEMQVFIDCLQAAADKQKRLSRKLPPRCITERCDNHATTNLVQFQAGCAMLQTLPLSLSIDGSVRATRNTLSAVVVLGSTAVTAGPHTLSQFCDNGCGSRSGAGILLVAGAVGGNEQHASDPCPLSCMFDKRPQQ